jgi:hypothetical protein
MYPWAVSWELWAFHEKVIAILLAWSIFGNTLRWYLDDPTPKLPSALLRVKAKFETGAPPRRYWDTCRSVPMFDEHYRQEPGRLSCNISPATVNGEKIYRLRIGFKLTADSKPSKYITIPVHRNGKIYDQ